MRIVFMGTPDFALPCLSALHKTGHTPVGVFSQPDRPAGRGHLLSAPPVKRHAMEIGIPVFQPESMKDAGAIADLRNLQPDLLIVVAYGQILRQEVLDIPRIAAWNLHASLLPHLRGAAPIQWAIVHGDTQTGITVQRIVRQLDAGDILLQQSCAIEPDDTAGSLHDRLAMLAADCLLSSLQLLKQGRVAYSPQDPTQVTWAPQLMRVHGKIDWSLTAVQCHNQVRGLSPWPGTTAEFRQQVIKILAAHLCDHEPIASAPCVVPDDITPGLLQLLRSQLRVQCGDGRWLELDQVQLSGRQPVSGVSFANGSRLQPGEILG